jgi:tight adherence protein B
VTLILIIGGFFILTFALVGFSGHLVLGSIRRRLFEIPAEVAAIRGQFNPSPILKQDQTSSIGVWGTTLERFNFSRRLKALLEEADLNWSVGRLAALMLLSGVCTVVVLSRFPFVPVLAALGAGSIACTAPYFWVRRKRGLKIERFDQAFPDALDSLSRSLKAGHPLAAAMDQVAAECEEPVSGEFRQTLDEWRLGRTWDQALGNLAVRVPSLQVATFVAAIRLHSRSGGKLTEVLGGLSETMRETSMLEGEIRALSAHGRMTGTILTALPLFIAFMMWKVNPGYMLVLVEDPTGRWLAITAAGCLIAAHFVIRWMLKVRF